MTEKVATATCIQYSQAKIVSLIYRLNCPLTILFFGPEVTFHCIIYDGCRDS